MWCSSLLVAAFAAEAIIAYPFVADLPDVDSSLFRGGKRQQSGQGQKGGPDTCPFNHNHVPAAPITFQFPYNSALGGLPGKGIGGYQVPAPGDTAHQFVPPGPNDIRGPCPGLNTAANHNFLAHDGISTLNELVDAQQNLYNVDYVLAVTLAVLGLTSTDGDITTEKLSIGCDATTRTSVNPMLTGSEPGLDGHNKFEGDTSLSRNDYFVADGDNYSFNGTLFGMMVATCNSNFGPDELALYRSQRYAQSLHDNPNFFFGPLNLLLFGAASFLYELMPSGPDYIPDLATISSFFGAAQNANGTWSFNNAERIPANWYNRIKPYSITDVSLQIVNLYLEYPILFGGATGNGGFDLLDFGDAIQGGKLVKPNSTTVLCLIYQLATQRVPSSLNGIVTPIVGASSFALTKLNPLYQNLGCPLRLT